MMLSQTIDDPQQSKPLAWSALEGFVESGNQYGAARAHLKLAYLASAEGDFEAARCHCESALPVFQRIGDKDDAAIALNILGMVDQTGRGSRRVVRAIIGVLEMTSLRCRTTWAKLNQSAR